jgi:hypothetical protein
MQVLRNIFYSFPFQLALLHLRRYIFMLVPWVLLILIVSGNMLSRLGFHYLFLDPEYFGKVTFFSFFLIGIALGGFIFVWNITSYILNSFRFPFWLPLNVPSCDIHSTTASIHCCLSASTSIPSSGFNTMPS